MFRNVKFACPCTRLVDIWEHTCVLLWKSIGTQVGIVGMVSHLVSILDAGEGGKEDGQKGEQLQDVEDEKA